MITSNLPSVIGRLEGLKKVLPSLPAKAMRGMNGELFSIANIYLSTHLTTESGQRAIPAILASLKATPEGAGIMYSMESKPYAVTREDSAMTGKSYTELQDEIEEWAREYKDLSAGESSERGARNAYFAMLEDPEPFFAAGIDGRGALNPKGLAQFMQSKLMPAEQLGDILRQILDLWRQHVAANLPNSLHQQIREVLT